MPVRFWQGLTEVIFGSGDVHMVGCLDKHTGDHVFVMGTGPPGVVGRDSGETMKTVSIQVVMRFPCLAALDTVILDLNEMRAEMAKSEGSPGGSVAVPLTPREGQENTTDGDPADR